MTDAIFQFPPGPYGTNDGDIWSCEESELGKLLYQRHRRLLIQWCARTDGVVVPHMQLLDADDPDAQALIVRAREGTKRYTADLRRGGPNFKARAKRQMLAMTEEEVQMVREAGDELGLPTLRETPDRGRN